MSKAVVLVTNNPKALEKYKDDPLVGVEFIDGDYLGVLTAVRDHVYAGWHLLSHPQASNLKPSQSPFKTILVSEHVQADDHMRDYEYIEFVFEAYRKHMQGRTQGPIWTERVAKDFMTVDLDIVESALNSCMLKQQMMAYKARANKVME